MISTHALDADQFGLEALPRRKNQRYGWYENRGGVRGGKTNATAGMKIGEGSVEHVVLAQPGRFLG